MTVVSTLGRGAASGLAGALVWAAVALLFLDAVDPRTVAIGSVALAVAVAAVTAISAVK